jgi:hypothetical protein
MEQQFDEDKKPLKLVKRSTDGRSVFFESVDGAYLFGRKENEVVIIFFFFFFFSSKKNVL